MARGHGPPHLGTLGSNPNRLRLQQQFLPSQQQHYQQTQPLRGPGSNLGGSGNSHNGAKTLYATHGTIANAPRFNQNSYEVSPSSFRYYSSSVEYLAGDFCHYLAIF